MSQDHNQAGFTAAPSRNGSIALPGQHLSQLIDLVDPIIICPLPTSLAVSVSPKRYLGSHSRIL